MESISDQKTQLCMCPSCKQQFSSDKFVVNGKISVLCSTCIERKQACTICKKELSINDFILINMECIVCNVRLAIIVCVDMIKKVRKNLKILQIKHEKELAFIEEFRTAFIKDCSLLTFAELTNKYKNRIPYVTLRSWLDKKYIQHWLEDNKLEPLPVAKVKCIGLMKPKYSDQTRADFIRDALGKKLTNQELAERYRISLSSVYKWREEGYFEQWENALVKRGIIDPIPR